MNPKTTNIGSIGYQLKAVTILTCMGLLAFWATFYSPFLYDDAHAIVENPYIQHLSDFQKNVGIGNIFNRSVLLLTFAVNREIGGRVADPPGHQARPGDHRFRPATADEGLQGDVGQPEQHAVDQCNTEESEEHPLLVAGIRDVACPE